MSDYQAALYQRGETHWWAAGMRRVNWALLGRVEGRVLDLGCGPGWMLREVQAQAWSLGLDRQMQRFVARPVVQGDAVRLPFPGQCFDLVITTDMLEQRGLDPRQALAEVWRVLRPGGRLLLRVPAHPWLMGPHDAHWGGGRRYRRAELVHLVSAAGFSLQRLTYVNSALFAPAVAARLLARLGVGGGDDVGLPPAPINHLLLALLSGEARWLRRHDLPFGLSLLCLAAR